MTRTRTAGLAIALCAALWPAPARADFAPQLAVSLEPPTAASAPALSATISNPVQDTAIERFTLSLPAGFTAQGAPAAQICAPAQVAAAACPPASLIGTVDGRVGSTLAFGGPVHKTGPASFAILTTTLAGALRQVVPGTLVTRADGALDVRVDRLPALALTSLAFRLQGGPRALFKTPASCGTYAVDGKFTSRSGELALARSLISVTGCSGVPSVAVTNLRMSRRSFRAGGSRSGYRTILAWSAARAVDHTVIRVERRVRARWRVAGRLLTGGLAGENRLRWDGRVRGRKLKRGRYALRVQPAGSAPSKLLRFRIR